jgi:transposase
MPRVPGTHSPSSASPRLSNSPGALGSALPELCSFVEGLDRDRKAVESVLQLSWSNGPVEGQVNRLKVIKRQMYGRANFDLLRARVLAA